MQYEAPAIELRESIEDPLVLGAIYASPTWTTEERGDG
jgi:hypothetical protein